MSRDDEEALHRVHEVAHDQRNALMATWFRFQATRRESRRLREEHQAARAVLRATIAEWQARRAGAGSASVAPAATVAGS